MSYLIGDRYKFVNDVQTKVYKSNTDLNKFQYGCYMAAGWNTWNFYAYYGLSPIYKSAKINGEDIKTVSYTHLDVYKRQPIDSSNMNPEKWVQIASVIEDNYAQFDGFVVLHGSDTMSYSCLLYTFRCV